MDIWKSSREQFRIKGYKKKKIGGEVQDGRYKLKYVIELLHPNMPGPLTQILMLFGQKEYWGGGYAENVLALGLHLHLEPSPAWVTMKTD